jgi:PAS domain S-box-containing protein
VTELSAYALSLLREGSSTLHRGHGDGLSPILLVTPPGEPQSPGSVQRLEHEYTLRADLDADWAAVPVDLLRRGSRLMLVLADPGGELLEGLLGQPMAVADFLHIAVPLAMAVGRLHARGLIHKDLKPANILVDTASGGVWLTGFGIASRLPREHQAPAPPEIIAGTLAYMAPEQTGRMNRSIDARSDLYALGVIFYEMLTGMLPFNAADPMEWVHCHIARQPVPPAAHRAGIPGLLSAIVMKLLAKTADERYQTAAGLAADLRHGLAEWLATGAIAPFPLGQWDVPDRLLIPEKLYGRERETETLLASFDRVVASGTSELVLVSGYSGIGKSSVVNELHKALVPPRGLFASGKFDQYKRDIPYATLAQAFRSLVRQILGQKEAELGQWRDALSEALGANGQLMVNLVPELDLVIGTQPPVADLPPQDAQKRFQMVFRRFLGVFARKEHPLALFFDDLQWLDTATLDLLAQLVTNSEVRHLMLVGAYRDNEVGRAHPLMRALQAIRSAGARIQELALAPLRLDDVTRLVADALHCQPERVRPLARLVHEKTGGNPFFAIQFLTALVDEELLTLDRDAPAWRWDIDRIRARSYTDNVVELMAGKLMRLPPTTQNGLKLLACLGNTAETATLAMIQGDADGSIDAQLWDAVRAGLVLRRDGSYLFLHDRIQEAAYSLIPVDQRAVTHLRIGRCLLAALSDREITEQIFDVVNQFNNAVALISDRDEAEQVADLNRRAGIKAKASTAYAAACRYFGTGMALVGPSGWKACYGLTFRLALEHAECMLLSGGFDDARKLIAELLRRADLRIDKAAVYRLKIDLHVMKSEHPQAVDSALECLSLFGMEMSAHPSRADVNAEYEKIWQQLGDRQIESLIDLPKATAAEAQAAMRVLAACTSPAFFTDPNLFNLQVCQMVNLSLEHGIMDASTHGFAWFGWLQCYAFHRYDDGCRFARLALDLVEKRGFNFDVVKVQYAMGEIVSWTQPLATAIEYFRTAFRTGVETGNLIFAANSAAQVIMRRILIGSTLDDVWHESERFMDFVAKIGFHDGEDMIVSQQRFVAAMRGKTANLSTFSDAVFDERAFEDALTADRMTTMVVWYWILKIGARFLSGDYAQARDAIDKAQPLLWASSGEIQLLDFHLYAALTLAALATTEPPARRGAWMARITEHRDQLRVWAQSIPETFTSAVSLVDAEIARLEDRPLDDAMPLYEQAIQAARKHGFVQNQALAYEVAARFYAARGYEAFAGAYLLNARNCYLSWGALGKVRQLDEHYPELRPEEPTPAPTGTIEARLAHLDLATVIKASQAVSGEIVLDRLMETLMTIALEHAGAERGLLLLLRDDMPQIEAEARTTGTSIEVTLQPVPLTSSALPETVLHTVIRTHHSVILDDASAPNSFTADAYVQQTHARSVLCLPLVKQAKLIGALYLENKLASNVFTPARISVLELLASQAAISLENAGLYAELKINEERWRNLFESVPVGVALTGPHGRYVATNRAFQRMTGYSEAELGNLSPLDIVHEDDRAATAARIAARAAGEPYPHHVEKRYRHKDGRVIWADASAFVAPVAAGIPYYAEAVIDITDRKRAEEDLRRSEASLAQAQEISLTGSWRWKVGTGEVSSSAELLRIWGFDAMATQPSYTTFMARVHPEDRLAFKQALADAARAQGRFQYEYRIVWPDGSIKYLQTVGQPDSAEGRDLEFVGTVMDITVRRQAEEALRDAQADLARAVRLTTMGELLASISHEVNQPLAAVATSGNACLRWLNREEPDLASARDAAARVVREAHRAADVIHSLRALARKSGPQLTKLDIHDAIEEVLGLTRGELQQHGVVLHLDLSADDPPVLGDKVQLQQVLLNLIMNGIQAMATVSDRKRELTVSAGVAAPDHMEVTIEDTGPGLDPAIAQRIFEPFFTTKSDGLGMGLSICRSIIEAHGGHLWTSPGTPSGTAFHFTIPIGGEA